jgi:hypothetical protein
LLHVIAPTFIARILPAFAELWLQKALLCFFTLVVKIQTQTWMDISFFLFRLHQRKAFKQGERDGKPGKARILCRQQGVISTASVAVSFAILTLWHFRQMTALPK